MMGLHLENNHDEVKRVNEGILFGKGDNRVYLNPKMANRHGLIAGATGTGKTVSLKVLAEAFSDLGVPVFLADVKGDLSGLGLEGKENSKILERLTHIGIDEFDYRKYPLEFWDVFGEKGIPVRTEVSEMGPLLLSRIMSLNETQSGILSVVFKIADDKGWLIIDLKDLKSTLQYVADHATSLRREYGNISVQSIGAIQRRLLVLEEQGGDLFFGEPALDIMDFIGRDRDGRGIINILSSETLYRQPQLYATFLLWLLAEIFEGLPEVGDMDKPKLVFFFDEAHLLFKDTSKALLDKIEQVVRLIRSKGVGVFFVTQSPSDIPDSVLGQLGNRVQHALRAYTPRDQKAVRVAAQTFRTNPSIDTSEAITQLAVGEALVSFLDEKGIPSIVERAIVAPPRSVIGFMEEKAIREVIDYSIMKRKYGTAIDRESAYEILTAKAIEAERLEKETAFKSKKEVGTKKTSPRTTYKRQSTLEKTTKSAMTAFGRQLGTTLARGILGSLKKP